MSTARDMITATAMPAVETLDPESLFDLIGETFAPLTGLVGTGVGVAEVVLEAIEMVVDDADEDDEDSVLEEDSVELVVDVGAAIVISEVVVDWCLGSFGSSGVVVGAASPSSVVVAAGIKTLERKLPNGSRLSCRSCRGAAQV